MKSDEVVTLIVSVTDLIPGSAVIIEKILLNNVQLGHLDSFGVYRTKHGTKKTYGYMYTFTISKKNYKKKI